ncbi:hypothetical protein MRX96_016952 [Rhipicephalus microplus]
MSCRSPSPKSPQREASFPPAAPVLASPTETPLNTADSSLSAQREILKVPSADALEDSQLEGKRTPAAEEINSLVQAQSLNNRSNFLEVDMWPGSIDMEIENENCAETESQAYFSCVTLDRNEGPQYRLQRMTGSSWSPKTFLTWLIVLSVIVFTLAVITTVFQTANESNTMENLELYDAIDDKQAATHESVELNTAIMSSRDFSGNDIVTHRGHLRAELRTKLSDSITASVDDNVIAVGAEDYSAVPAKRASSAPTTVPDDGDVEEVI